MSEDREMADTQKAVVDARHSGVSESRMPFRPRHIIFRRLIPNPVNYDLSLYEAAYTTMRVDAGDLERAISAIGRLGYHSPFVDPGEDVPLDIPVHREVAIVVQLPFSSRYHFLDPAIILETAGGEDLSHIYGELRYLDRSGGIHENHVPFCKTVYFIADVRRGTEHAPYKQHFNYNIFPPPPRAGAMALIDPDIRHPGNGGQSTVDGEGGFIPPSSESDTQS